MRVVNSNDKKIVCKAGEPVYLGVRSIGKFINFAIDVPGTEEVTLHLYKKGEIKPEFSILLTKEDCYGNIFSVQVSGIESKEYEYTYEVKGYPFVDPRCSLLVGRDHYGKKLTGKERKNLRAAICTTPYNWQDDARLGTPLCDSILYKLHVRGFSKNANVKHPGTYLGLSEKADYLKSLGITAVLLMPVFEFNEMIEPGVSESVPNFNSSRFYKSSIPENQEISNDEQFVDFRSSGKTKVNYWGYTDHYFFFAPKASYAADPANADVEFRDMVKKLHKKGIEVLLEVNLPAGTNRSLILDALRFWVREYHIDGYRLNLDQTDACMLAEDPFLSGTKLLGSGWGCATSKEGAGQENHLAEYHDGFLTDVRHFLKSDEGFAGSFSRRIATRPHGCGVVNYITDHNGFTLADLYMYDVKHNDDNGENGRDGTDYNYSWNCGAEGPDKRKKVRELRLRMKKNALMSLLLAQGTPMLLSGDEFGNSQGGNNNAYCQDNEIGWLDWKAQRSNTELLNFTKSLIALRKNHPVFHNVLNLRGVDYLSCGLPDVSYHSTKAWFPDEAPYNRGVGILLGGSFAKTSRTEHDQSYYLLFNMYWEPQTFDIPLLPAKEGWNVLLASDSKVGLGTLTEPSLEVPSRTIVLLESMAAAPVEKKPRKKAKADEA